MIQNNNATQTVLDNSNKSTFDLSTFKKAVDNMIATNGAAYSGINSYFRTIKKKTKTYTPEEIANIIESGSLIEQRELSQNYFRKDGLYKKNFNILCYSFEIYWYINT